MVAEIPPTRNAWPLHPRFPIALVHEPARGTALLDMLAGRRPLFVCVAAHTDTVEIDGLSGAGATAELRRLTATADIEALFHGRPVCIDGVPSHPAGVPGPVIMTIAALRIARARAIAVDAGLRIKPGAPTIRLGSAWGRSITSGRAVPHAAQLFQEGIRLGQELARDADYLVLGESVPGGTTTALAVLCGLGIDAWGKVSSSMRENPHALKERVVRQALRASGLTNASIGTEPQRRDPLAVAAAVGDPMQPVVAGLALGAIPDVPVLLAGGSQMVAVLALAVSIAREAGADLDRIGIATTPWVARDPTADLSALMAEVAPAPVFACDLDFATSRHCALRAYEHFLVKEGVGAGGAMVAAMLAAGASRQQIVAEVEAVYEAIYGSQGPSGQPPGC